MEDELENPNGRLAKVIKRLNFGQFLFLYFVARNEDFEFVQELISQLKARGAPEWTKTKGQKKKDSRQEVQTDKNLIPLQNLNGAESGPPSYNSSHRPSIVNIESEKEKHSPQAPPLEEKPRLPPITTDYAYNQGRMYPPVLAEEPLDVSVPEYSEASTLRKRKDSTEDKRED